VICRQCKLKMDRLYVKKLSEKRWKTVGWLCPACGEIVID